jgi:hypothetical protein
LIDFAAGQVDCRDSGRGGDDQFFPIRRVRVLIEIKARAARLARETDDAMAGVGIDPLRGRFVGAGDAGEGEE